MSNIEIFRQLRHRDAIMLSAKCQKRHIQRLPKLLSWIQALFRADCAEKLLLVRV
jgi:hypothetical protein